MEKKNQRRSLMEAKYKRMIFVSERYGQAPD